MSKVINIGNVDYTFEFTMEASLYSECTEKVTSLMYSIEEAQNKNDIKKVIMGISDIPQTALTLFYAGLLENHGVEGDGTVESKSDAKKLIKQYLDEHKEDDCGNFYDVMNKMIEIMADDGFFELIGLGQMFKEEKPKKVQPQDHKKKQTTKKVEAIEK